MCRQPMEEIAFNESLDQELAATLPSILTETELSEWRQKASITPAVIVHCKEQLARVDVLVSILRDKPQLLPQIARIVYTQHLETELWASPNITSFEWQLIMYTIYCTI